MNYDIFRERILLIGDEEGGRAQWNGPTRNDRVIMNLNMIITRSAAEDDSISVLS